MLWAVTRLLKQGCSYSYTNITPVLRYLRPGLPRCYLVMSDVGVLLSKQLLFSDRMVHLWIFPHSRPPQKPQTHYPSPVPLLLVTSSSPRGSPQCIAFKRYCTCQHLTAVQRNVCHAKGVFCTTSLAISAKDFAAAFECLFDITKKEKKELRTPNCDHTTTITTSTTTIQILQGLFCICECRLSATFVRHGIVSISLYFNHGKKQITSFIFKTNGGYFFN